MVELVLLVVVALAVLALLAVTLLQVIGRAKASSAVEEATRAVRDQVGDSLRLLHELGERFAVGQAETRELGQRQRAEAAEAQTGHLSQLQAQLTGVLDLVQKQLEESRKALNDRLQGMTTHVTEQLGGNAKVMQELRGQLGGLAETAKRIQELSRDIGSLQDILRAPKLRGNLGELFLEEILRQVLPAGSFEMQYRLPGADRGQYVTVDAVIHLGERLVPIDSKFPLESFQRLSAAGTDEERGAQRKEFLAAVKRQIDEIASKYIRPDAGTYDFALMYLPAENVYYEAVIRTEASVGPAGAGDGVMGYAARAKVIPVSPNTLYAYLSTIAYGLKGMQIERQAEAIRAQLADFQKRFAAFFVAFEKIGRNLELAQKHFDDSSKRAVRLNEQVGKITGQVTSLETASLGDGAPPPQLEPGDEA